MPYHKEYEKQEYEREPRHYASGASEVWRHHIYQETARSYDLSLRINDLAMWCQDEPLGLYRQIYNSKKTFTNRVRPAEEFVIRHGVRVRESQVVYRPSKRLMGELEMLDGLFRVTLRDKYFETTNMHFDHLQNHGDYDRLVYNMDMHRRESNAYTNIPYTSTLWFGLRALKLYWDSLITKEEQVDVSNLLRFTSKTLVDVEEAIHDQQFHNVRREGSYNFQDQRRLGVHFFNQTEVALLHEFAKIIRVVEKQGLRMQVMGEIMSSGFEGVSFKLKDIYRTICGHNYEPRAAWRKKEGQMYQTYIENVECIYRFVSTYERNRTQPFIEPVVLTDMLDRLRQLLRLNFLQDVQDFLDVYELWKERVTVNAAYVPPAAAAAHGWQPSWATGTQTQMRELLEGL